MDQETRTRLARLAARARESEQLHRDDVEARDLAIEEADVAGDGVRDIARATELAPSTVHAIVIARAAARQVVS